MKYALKCALIHANISKIITKFKLLKFLWNLMANFTYISKIVDSIYEQLKNANDVWIWIFKEELSGVCVKSTQKVSFVRACSLSNSDIFFWYKFWVSLQFLIKSVFASILTENKSKDKFGQRKTNVINNCPRN